MLQRPNFGSNEQSGPVIQQNNSKWTKPFCGDEVLMQKMKTHRAWRQGKVLDDSQEQIYYKLSDSKLEHCKQSHQKEDKMKKPVGL
jgi:hypothetical protein